MYEIISLGHACYTKTNINRLFKEQETIFFDWIITDFKSVLYVLQNINNKDLISSNNFSNQNIFINRDSWKPECHKIEHKDFKMVSIHDFSSDIPYLDYMDTFILKYNRRLDRLEKIINSDKNVHMIHSLDNIHTPVYIITNKDIENFFNYLNIINPNNKCILHIVIPPEYSNIDLSHLIQSNVYVYHLIDEHPEWYCWAKTTYNWNIVFDNIAKIG